jgi:hypothetical protein
LNPLKPESQLVASKLLRLTRAIRENRLSKLVSDDEAIETIQSR